MLVLEISWAGITNAFLSSLADETLQKQLGCNARRINYGTVGSTIFTNSSAGKTHVGSADNSVTKSLQLKAH